MSDKIIRGKIADRIVDQKSFLLHVVEKAKLLREIARIADVPTDTHDHLRYNDPLVAALHRIINRLEKVHPRPTRSRQIAKFLRWGLKLMQNDNTSREVVEYLLLQLYEHVYEVLPYIDRTRADPRRWYPNPRPGSEEADQWYVDYERSADIAAEYLLWYGVDITKDISITPEHRDALIEAGRRWMQAYEEQHHGPG